MTSDIPPPVVPATEGEKDSRGRSGGDHSEAAVGVVGVVVVSWNVCDLLAECLSSLQATSVPVSVVVVDNASADGTGDMLRRDFPHVVLVQNDSNLGFTRANNQGMQRLGVGSGESPPDNVLLLNPDTRIVDDALLVLVDYLSLHEGVGIVGPELRYPDGSLQSSCRRFPSLLSAMVESTPVEWHWPNNPVSRELRMGDESPPQGPVDWITGAAMLVRTAALEQVGLFDEEFFMYSEELDLCRRFFESGWQVHFVPQARILHHEGASSDQVVPLRHRRFFGSRVRYIAKHHSAGAALLVRVALTAQFVAETGLESAKWIVGSRRDLRRERVRAYAQVVSTLWTSSTDEH